jgi:polyisoprenoid-binding protein YceI
MNRIFAWTCCIAFVGTAVVARSTMAAEYKLTGDNTKIEFIGTKPDGKHSGSFPKLSGAFDAPDDLTKAKITVKIDMDALESDDPKLTAHLKSPDFFETKKYPEARFVSKKIKSDKQDFVVTGDLTLHGKTKEISFPAKMTNANGAAGLEAEFSINRSDWGISYGPGKIDEAVKLSVFLDTKAK